nr:hypothetical protein [Mesorhizobium sp.]
MRIDAHFIAETSNRALQQVADAEPFRDLRRRQTAVAICTRGIVRDDEQAGNARQLCRQIVRETVGKIGLLLGFAEIRERQNRDRERGRHSRIKCRPPDERRDCGNDCQYSAYKYQASPAFGLVLVRRGSAVNLRVAIVRYAGRLAFGDKAISPSRDCLEQALLLVADGFPDFADALGKTVFRHRDAGPDSVQELLLGHDTVGVGDQMLQHRERLRPQRDIFTMLAAQETGVEIELDTV